MLRSNKERKTNVTVCVFKTKISYKGLYFSVFNTTNTENRVKVKYSIKNNNTNARLVFLATKNQSRAITSSMINLIPRAKSKCIVWLSESFFCPLKKIRMVIRERKVKENDSIVISRKLNSRSKSDVRISPVTRMVICRIARLNIFLYNGFKDVSLQKIFDCVINCSENSKQ